LGHVLSLTHCEDYCCAMASSHTVEWIDLKGHTLCEDCRRRSTARRGDSQPRKQLGAVELLRAISFSRQLTISYDAGTVLLIVESPKSVTGYFFNYLTASFGTNAGQEVRGVPVC
jgi:hypothetical protein